MSTVDLETVPHEVAIVTARWCYDVRRAFSGFFDHRMKSLVRGCLWNGKVDTLSVFGGFFACRRIVIKLLVTYFQKNHSKEV